MTTTPAQNPTGQKVFGSGYFWGTNNTANSTPTAFLALQNMSIDFKREIKYLHGVNQLAIAVGSGKLTVTGKAEIAALNARVVNDLLLGTTITNPGQLIWIKGESGTVPAVSAYTVTVANAATWTTDLGVVMVTPGASSTIGAYTPFVRVASNPAAGQYSVAAGVYTFASGDASAAVSISYEYTYATSGQKINMTNQPMGAGTNFTAVMGMFFGTDKSTIQLNNCTAGGLSLATKLDDFAMQTLDFGCATDSSDSLGTFSFTEAT